jgi:hypothetical protein
MNATEYIPREAVLALKEEIGAYGMDICSEKVKAIPAADVVPVVRCRDCKYYNAAEQDCDFLFGMVYPEENDYCSNGELKEGAQK